MQTIITNKSDIDTLATQIREAHTKCESAVKQGLAHAIEAGNLLIVAKKQIGHGNWLPWLKDNCNLSERTAQAYMRVAKRLPELESKAQHVADLSFRDAIDLLAEPRATENVPVAKKPSLDPFIERATELLEIRERGLWREAGHESWDQYCTEFLGGSAEQVDSSIALAVDICTGAVRRLIPPPDKYTLLNAADGSLNATVIVPSTHEGFYYVANILSDDFDGASVAGTKKPVRGDVAHHFIDKGVIDIEPVYQEPREDSIVSAVPWDYNRLLYHSKQEHIDRVVLGKAAR